MTINKGIFSFFSFGNFTLRGTVNDGLFSHCSWPIQGKLKVNKIVVEILLNCEKDNSIISQLNGPFVAHSGKYLLMKSWLLSLAALAAISAFRLARLRRSDNRDSTILIKISATKFLKSAPKMFENSASVIGSHDNTLWGRAEE